jgi:PPK2 family polyphosphate:nucleotide phosphotransferase
VYISIGIIHQLEIQMSEIKLGEIDTRAPKEFEKEKALEKTDRIIQDLDDLQNRLYADANHSILVVLQGMDASGKDRTIRRVFGKLNPLGVKAYPFKAPETSELAHDFLWRVHKLVPAKGMMTVFNRSHYEDVLVTRVHGWCNDEKARKRMKAINQFEELLTDHNNTTILKFYLHVSHKEQLERLNERIKEQNKKWKYNKEDFAESALWDKYTEMYEEVFKHCNRIPWMIIPADQKWYKDYLVAKTVRDALEKLDLQYPGLKK